MLVNGRADLRSMFVLCLGKLHFVFAYLRAIGTLAWHRLSLDEVKIVWQEYRKTSIEMLYNALGARGS